MESRDVFVLITLFFCFCLNISYSNDYNEQALLAKLPYDVGEEDSIRDWEVLRPYIEGSVNKNERMYFKNRYEVQYAQELGLIDRWTGEILYKPKVNKVTEISEAETAEILCSETDAILRKPKVNKVTEISEAETAEKVDCSETSDICKSKKKSCCSCM